LDNLISQIASLEDEKKDMPDINNQNDQIKDILSQRTDQRMDASRRRAETNISRESSRAAIPARRVVREGAQRSRMARDIESDKQSSESSRRRNPSNVSKDNSEVETEKTLISSTRGSPTMANGEEGADILQDVSTRLERSGRSSRTAPSTGSARSRIRRDRDRDMVKPRSRSGSISSNLSDFINRAAQLKIGALFNDEFSEAATSYTNDSNVPDLTDPLTLNSLLVQATADSEGFPVLSPDRYLDQKKRLVQISNAFESIQNKLSLEVKVKEATQNVIKFNSDSPKQVEEATLQLRKSERKMQELSKGREILSQTYGL
jgi:hypothetical protein